jgi:hypothetical protein
VTLSVQILWFSHIGTNDMPANPGKSGSLNGSMRHLPKVFFCEATRVNSFACINSNKTKPCLGSD